MRSDSKTLVSAMRIVARDIYCKDGAATAVIAEAACRIEELEQAIRRLADQDATLSVQGGNVIVMMDATLTDAEREAVEVFAAMSWTSAAWSTVEQHADALRGLLKRMGGGR